MTHIIKTLHFSLWCWSGSIHRAGCYSDAGPGSCWFQVGVVKALVRWSTGKRLTNRVPKLSLVTLSPPLNCGILGLRMGSYVPTPKFFYNLWGPRESDLSDSWHEEIHFSLKSVFMVDVRFEITTNDPWYDDAICEGISPLGYWWKVNQSPTKTKRYNRVWM